MARRRVGETVAANKLTVRLGDRGLRGGVRGQSALGLYRTISAQSKQSAGSGGGTASSPGMGLSHQKVSSTRWRTLVAGPLDDPENKECETTSAIVTQARSNHVFCRAVNGTDSRAR